MQDVIFRINIRRDMLNDSETCAIVSGFTMWTLYTGFMQNERSFQVSTTILYGFCRMVLNDEYQKRTLLLATERFRNELEFVEKY